MAWTFAGSAVATLTDPVNGVGSVTTSAGLNVQAGDVLVALCSDPVSSVVGTDSLNSMAVGSFADNNGNFIGFAWRLASQASTGELFQATASGFPQALSLTILQLRPPLGATVTLDASPALGTTSWTSIATSGTISTTGTDDVLIGGMVSANQSSIYSGMTIAGASADGAVSTDYQTIAYRMVAAAQSVVSAVASASTSSNLIAGILAFKAATSTSSVSLSDSASTSDVISAAMVSPRALTDSIASSDSLSVKTVSAQAILDSMATSDSIGAKAVFSSTLSETVSTSDTYTAAIIFNVTLSDSIASSDAISLGGGGTWSVTLADSLSISDALSISMIASVALSESAATGDAYTNSMIGRVILSDSTPIADALPSKAIFGATLADSITTADSIDSSAIRRVSLADILGTVDAFATANTDALPQICIDGAWKTVSAAFVSVGGTWKLISGIRVNISHAWKTTST